MESKDRKMWLIDGQYLFKACPEGDRADYLRLREWLERDGEIAQGYYVDSRPDHCSEGQRRFWTWLKYARPDGPQLQVRLHPLKSERTSCPSCGSEFQRPRQKGVDVDIVTLALTRIDRYDTLLLSAGDGDFLGALEYIRNTMDKRLELVAFRGSVSADLQALADEIHWIDDVLGDLVRPARAA